MRRPPLLPLILVAALVVGVALVAPAWVAPGALAPGTRFTDGHLLGVALWGEALRAGTLPSLHTPLVAWPTGADLRPLLWPACLLEVVVGPALAVTLTFALTPAFNALGGWMLGRALGRAPAGCALLAALLAVHPWVVETLTNGQVEQAVIGGAAAQLAVSIWAVGRADKRALLLPGVCTALLGWAAPHVALAGCLLAGLWALPPLVRGEARVRWMLVLLSLVVGALAVQAYHAPSFAPGVHVFAPKGSDGRPTALADLPEVATLAGLVWPPRASTAPVVHATWLGFVLLAAAAWGALRGDRQDRRALGVAAVLAVFALGPTVTLAGATFRMPWTLLAEVAPTIARSMSAYRLVAGAAVALAALASAAPRSAAPALLIGALAFAEGLTFATRPLPIPAQPAPSDSGRAALAAGAGPVLDLPLAGPECPAGVGHYLVQAALTQRPVPLQLTNPRAGYAAVQGMVGTLARTWGAPDCAARLGGVLDKLPFTTVVLHHHDRDCPVPQRVAACLDAALGPGEAAADITSWNLR